MHKASVMPCQVCINIDNFHTWLARMPGTMSKVIGSDCPVIWCA